MRENKPYSYQLEVTPPHQNICGSCLRRSNCATLQAVTRPIAFGSALGTAQQMRLNLNDWKGEARIASKVQPFLNALRQAGLHPLNPTDRDGLPADLLSGQQRSVHCANNATVQVRVSQQ
ncbi:hypothetical protein KBB12_04340 [Candidatus Woesebacteria bacterium]|nr:hypothetical protein [Candidatus Woesebacteria bacterium]